MKPYQFDAIVGLLAMILCNTSNTFGISLLWAVMGACFLVRALIRSA